MKKLCIIIGCGSSLARNIKRKYELLPEYDIIGTYNNDACNDFNIDKIHYNLKNKMPKVLLNKICDYSSVDIWWLAATKSFDLQDCFNINFFAPVNFYNNIKNLNMEKRFIIFSSQGDLHGSIDNNPYNASKAALSSYFEPIALKSTVQYRILLVKPWLFESKMNSNSFLSITGEKIVNSVFTSLKKQKHIIIKHYWTYFLVQIVKIISIKFLYNLITSLKK
jgi:hypothetical protein